MTTEQALLAAIADFPSEDTPRLELADWLEEFSENGCARADAIRRGVANPKWFTFAESEVAHLSYAPTRYDLGDRVNVTLAVGYPGVTWHSYKGLIAALTCTWETWLATGDNILARNWVPEVILSTVPQIALQDRDDGDPGKWAWVPGRESYYTAMGGEDFHRITMSGEWPAVRRWVLPEPILGLRWYMPEAEEMDDEYWTNPPDENQTVDPDSVPQVGSTVTTIDGRRGVLMTRVDARGLGCVRSVL